MFQTLLCVGLCRNCRLDRMSFPLLNIINSPRMNVANYSKAPFSSIKASYGISSCCAESQEIWCFRTYQNTVNLHLFALHLTPVSRLPVAVGITLNANSIILGSRGKGQCAGTDPGAKLGEHCAPHLQPLPGSSRGWRCCRVPWDTWASRDPLVRSQTLGFGIPCIQHSIIWFYLSCEGCGIESTWKQLDSH